MMDPALAREILSRISPSPSSVALSKRQDLPFFAQREEEEKTEEAISITSPDASAVIGDDNESSALAAKRKGSAGNSNEALFITACPIRNISTSTYTSKQSIPHTVKNGSGCFPALYSREFITREFLEVLRLHRGRISASEMCTWLGMEEESVGLVGDWVICSSKTKQGLDLVWKVYNPVKQQNEYAMVKNLTDCLRERIALHCSSSSTGQLSSSSSAAAVTSRDKYCPPLDIHIMARQKLDLSSSSKNINMNHLTQIATATASTKQLALEMELTCEDLELLSEDKFKVGSLEDDASANNRDIAMLGESAHVVYNSQVVDSTHQYLEMQVMSALSGVTIPTSLEALFGQESHGSREESSVVAMLFPIAKSLCKKRMLHGVISNPSSSFDTNYNAIYIPHVYSRSQRRIANAFFQMNGHLTETKWVALGISRNRVEKFVKNSFPKAVLLSNSILDPNKICAPLESAVQTALLNQSFAALKSQLPDGIASSEEDVSEIINNLLPILLKEQKNAHEAFLGGITIVNCDMVFFFCEEMVKECKKMLIPLVEEYSKKRAKEILNEQPNHDTGAGGKASNKKKQGLNSSQFAGELDLVPLLDVANDIGAKYPELLNLHQQHEHDNTCDAEKSTLWNEDGRIGNDGPLIEFCRCALFSDDLQHMCSRSVKAEVDRLNSTRHGMSVSSRSEGAAKIQNIGNSFKYSFRLLCHLLQIFAKSLGSLQNKAQRNNKYADIDPIVDSMKQELLLGCGSCLARLITEYCLFKHAGEVETKSCLFFESRQEKAGEITPVAPSCFEAVDVAALKFPFFLLRCRPDKHGKPQSPLDYLSSVLFPGSSGSSLSQMWVLCSHNGNGNSHEAGNNLEKFIDHLSDFCLTLVGIPFSVLDKKTERKVLTARRDGILKRLENSREKEEVAICAVVLIYHQVKNVPISGIETINAAMSLLVDGKLDKKIPQQVAGALLSLRGTNGNDSLCLIEQVKRFGSAKNSKALADIVSS